MKKLINKNNFILSKCKNKNVLDLGCVDHDLYKNKIVNDSWLHDKIKQISNSIIGVDILKENVEFLKTKGYKIVHGNVENLNEVPEINGKSFDIIIAGDLIEHLFNAGLFLESIKSFCNSSTEIIITTPNCFSIKYISPYLFKNKEKVRKDHTCWYSKNTLIQLLKMKGFKTTGFYFSSNIKVNGIRPFLRFSVRKLFPYLSEGLVSVSKIA